MTLPRLSAICIGARRLAAVVLAALLAACGGGSSTSAAGCAAGAALEIVADTAVEAGRAAAAGVLGCRGPLREPRWTQIAGAPVALLSARTQAISIEAPAGSYRFRVDAVDADNIAVSAEATIAVTQAGDGIVTVRGDKAMRTGGRTSLRAWPALVTGDTVASITWTQIEGPPALDLDGSTSARLLFTVPAVARDTLLRFRVVVVTARGATASDEASVVVEALPPAPAGQLFRGLAVERVYPWRAGGPYADRLVDCVYSPALFFSGGSTNLCPLSRLPLIAAGAPSGVPSIEAILDRVVVSHDWMGEVFEQFLRTQDVNGDLRRLFGSVTAIVLGAHVRPSNYWSATGAIYIDAERLWLTAQQRDVVSEAPDFRLDFDRDLQYSAPWRYTIGNAEAQLDFVFDRRAPPRDVGYLLYELGPLLYHELAHANDVVPSAARAALDATRLVYEAAPALQPSDRLAASQSLQSAEMFALARVKFLGAAASETQKALSPAQVADFFRADRATDEYSYTRPDSVASPREDLAMLFEEFMMSHRHGVRRDVAFTSRLRTGQTGADLIVAWGSRGRIGESAIRPRLRQILGEIAPWIDTTTVDALPAPVPMRAGESWVDNLNLLPAPAASLATRSGVAASGRGRSIEQQLRRPYALIVMPARQDGVWR